MICSACMADVPDEDVFCENCGAPLSQAATEATACLCEEMDEEGFCLQCGKRVRRPAGDHVEEALSLQFAAVSDRGQRHDRNEDRFALVQEERGLAVVVCDGVSTTSRAEVASAMVAEIVARELRSALQLEQMPNGGEVLEGAIAAAAAELNKEIGGRWSESAPSTTVVAALVRAGEITVAWAGDSRAYWVDEHGAVALTKDHSWMNAALQAGELTEEQARASPQAHAIMRWIGADADPAMGPEVVRRTVQTSGTLLLCTDGLWNYAPSAEQIAELMLEANGDALSVAQHLVAFSNAQGGRDNITAAVLRLPGPEPDVS